MANPVAELNIKEAIRNFEEPGDPKQADELRGGKIDEINLYLVFHHRGGHFGCLSLAGMFGPPSCGVD